jgi:hypothetical protein
MKLLSQLHAHPETAGASKKAKAKKEKEGKAVGVGFHAQIPSLISTGSQAPSDTGKAGCRRGEIDMLRVLVDTLSKYIQSKQIQVVKTFLDR